MSGAKNAQAFPVEEFLQALTSQLDRAQDALAVKVRTGRPLTWALKDLTLELRVFVEVDARGRVLMRSASPNEEGASTVKLDLTTITRPVAEENTFTPPEDADPRSLDDLRASANVDENTQRRLEWMGIRTVGQLRQLSQQGDARHVAAMSGIPALNLQALLTASSRPAVSALEAVTDAEGVPLLRVHGANLSDGEGPEVLLDGEVVEVLEHKPERVLVRPREHHREGPVEVRVGGQSAKGYFRIPAKGGGAR